MHGSTLQIMSKVTACWASAVLLWLVAPAVRADETANNFRSRAVANGEFLLLQNMERQSVVASETQQPGSGGGASMADFSMLMSLIQTTVDPDLWESGDATMQAYPGGIFLDTDGVVRRCKTNASLDHPSANFLSKRDAHQDGGDRLASADWKHHSSRRVISMNRLTRAVEECAKRGQPWDRELTTLAALQRIDFVVLDHQGGDLLLIGPAGGEVTVRNGTWIHSSTDTSPILLQDVLAISAAFAGRKSPVVLCSLDPTADGIARVHALLNQPDAASRLVRNPTKGAEELAKTMGMHQVSISGLEPSSPTALALLEADIHMKHLGLGLEKSKGSLTSYPDWSEKLGLQPSGQLLRWWFTPDYPEIQCNTEQTVFALPTQRVRLESERQMMDAAGNRNADGFVDEAADRFAQQFTANFSAIQKQYPLYGRLSHIFDVAVACKLAIEHSKWQSALLVESSSVGQVPKDVAPTTATGTWRKGSQVHKWIVVSGGVELNLQHFDVKTRLTSTAPLTSSRVGQSRPDHEARTYWWWDEAAPLAQ